MSNSTEIKLAKWPFFAADAVLLGVAYFIYWMHGKGAMTQLELFYVLVCGLLGAGLAVTPFLLEYRTSVKMVETNAVVSTILHIQNLEDVARNITTATAQWQGVQEHSNGAIAAAKQISDKMAVEANNFAEFLKQANDTEKGTLRLEVEKLRRSEAEWLALIVHLMDHTYALYRGGARTGQPALIEQLTRFQATCREAIRRVGLVPIIPAENEKFNPEIHQSPDSQADSMANARIKETIATGYTYQGRLIRPPVVALQNPPPPSLAKGAAAPAAESIKPAPTPKPDEESLEEPTLL
jgi:molecular chaperone GrpE (heat shock protein)